MAHSPLLLQLIVILGCARILGLILRFLGQPMVIGEMLAGLMLGPGGVRLDRSDTTGGAFSALLAP
jgi:Kef-type K+ transport system membrane component KefB